MVWYSYLFQNFRFKYLYNYSLTQKYVAILRNKNMFSTNQNNLKKVKKNPPLEFEEKNCYGKFNMQV